jgi:NAD(P)-dependent dehydrogenase (short-subunit alcohol dehydrogenase family)
LGRVDVDRVIATCRTPEASEGLARLRSERGDALTTLHLDVRDEQTVAAAAASVASEGGARLDWLINCAGLLHDGEIGPEKKLEDVDLDNLRAVFEVNAFGPLVVAKHFLGLLRHDARAVLANVSARVGSIGDNRLGGWYAYRASKAAQNMFTRSLAIELGRRAPNAICLALHPGTVDTDLARPFQGNVPAERLFDAKRAAEQLLGVIDSCTPEDSGRFLAWDGQPIPW